MRVLWLLICFGFICAGCAAPPTFQEGDQLPDEQYIDSTLHHEPIFEKRRDTQTESTGTWEEGVSEEHPQDAHTERKNQDAGGTSTAEPFFDETPSQETKQPDTTRPERVQKEEVTLQDTQPEKEHVSGDPEKVKETQPETPSAEEPSNTHETSEHVKESPKDNPTECKAGETAPCYNGATNEAGVGICRAGVRSCSPFGEWGDCLLQVLPQAERCNGKDDDCNGKVDDMPPQSCYSSSIHTAGVGVCISGTAHCSGGSWGACLGQVLPSNEQCNGKDDDCDGSVDENLSSVCKTSCGHGTSTCSLGTWQVCSAPLPRKEICNKIDDDCDGTVDESCQKSCAIVGTYPKEITGPHRDTIQGLTFHPNGTSFYTYSQKDVREWELATGSWKKEYQTTIPTRSLHVSPNGASLFLGDVCRRVYEWETQTGYVRNLMEASESKNVHGCIEGAGYTGVTNKLALSTFEFNSLGTNYRLELFNTSTGLLDKIYKLGEVFHTKNAFFHPSGQQLLIPWINKKQENPPSVNMIVDLKLFPQSNYPFGFTRSPSILSKNGQQITVLQYATNGDHILKRFDWTTKNLLSSWTASTGLSSAPASLGSSVGEKYLVTAALTNNVGHIKLWDVGKKTLKASISSSVFVDIKEVASSHDGAFIGILYSNGGQVRFALWDVFATKTIYTTNFPTTGFAFAPDKKTLVIYGDSLVLWDLATKKVRSNTPKYPSTPPKAQALALAPDGSTLAFVIQRDLYIQDLKTGLRRALVTLNDTVHSMDYHPTKALVALLYTDKVELYDTTNGTLSRVLTGVTDIRQGFFQDDGKTFMANSSSKKGLHFWDITTGMFLRTDVPLWTAPTYMSRDGRLMTTETVLWAPYKNIVYLKNNSSSLSPRFTQLDPLGIFVVREHASYNRRTKELLDTSGNSLFQRIDTHKREDAYFSPYALNSMYIGAYGKLLFMSEGTLMGVWSRISQSFIGYTPGLQGNLSLPQSSIATSKDSKTIAARIQDNYIRVWKCAP